MVYVENDYRATCNEFSILIDYGVEIANGLAQREASEREYYADRIFAKLLSHAITLKRILPTGLIPELPESSELWDISSACAISRSLIETYDALAYIAIDNVQEEVRGFRILLWNLHAEERRLKMLELIRSELPVVAKLKEKVDVLRSMVIAHPIFETIDENKKKKVREKNAPSFHMSQQELNIRTCVDHGYYTVSNMFLSSYVHTYPFSIQQLIQFRAGNPECLELMSCTIQYAVGFLAKGIEGMGIVFRNILPPPSMKMLELLELWIDCVKVGTSVGNSELGNNSTPPARDE